MARIDEIGARIDEIEVELRSDSSDVGALTAELDGLFAEQKKIEEDAATRSAYLETIANNKANDIKTTPIIEERKEETNMENKIYSIDTHEYREAWLKYAQRGDLETLTAEERAAMTSAANSAGYAIPTETANKIITNLTKIAPLTAYAQILHVPANLVLPIEGTVNAAAEHTEAADITPSSDTLNKIELGAHEIVKMVEISEKVKAMAVPAFEAWITEQLARKLAETIDDYMINGDGGTTKPCYGINSAETWSNGNNAVDWASTSPTVAELITAIGLIPAAYAAGAKVLVNHKTYWTKIFNLRDDKFQPVVTTEGGKNYLFGFEVIIDEKVANDVMFFGDPYEGLIANFAEDVSVQVHPDFSHWSMKYRGTCLFDCKALAGRWVKCAASL